MSSTQPLFHAERASLFPQNTLHACMTELHYLAFERQKLSHPKQLAEQHYNENALEKHRLDWQIKYRNCPTTSAQLPRVSHLTFEDLNLPSPPRYLGSQQRNLEIKEGISLWVSIKTLGM